MCSTIKRPIHVSEEHYSIHSAYRTLSCLIRVSSTYMNTYMIELAFMNTYMIELAFSNNNSVNYGQKVKKNDAQPPIGQERQKQSN